MESSNQTFYGGRSRNQELLKSIITHGCNLTFDPLKTSTQGHQEEMIKHFLPIKTLDSCRKHLNRQNVTTPWPYTVISCKLIAMGNRLAHKLETIKPEHIIISIFEH